MKSPFLLENQEEYLEWRNFKLSQYPVCQENFIVKFNNNIIDKGNINLLKKLIKKYNFAIYEFESKLTDYDLHNFCSKLDLNKSISNLFSDSENISNITNKSEPKNKITNSEYIPYTEKRLNWHTDGYYYPTESSIKSFLLHCVQPAKKGGENILLDHEIMYIYLRDHNPDYINILMQKDIMKIPKNKNLKDSNAISGPVFYIDENNFLNMRFTSREQNIIWQKNDTIKKIKDFMFSFINEDTKYTFKLLLQENQGYLANNILHKRESYIDGKKKRLLKRIRFSNRIGKRNANIE